MQVIGVTGGMASGKSTVARMIAGRGILHVDADQLVHRLMREDAETISAIAKKFPAAVKGGQVHRAALAEAIGKNPAALATLEQILHPRVRALEEEMIRRARRHRLRAVVLDIPLLFETGAHALCDRVIVAHAAIAMRRRRAFARAGMTEEKWQRLIARQLPDHHRRHAADIVVYTGIGKAATRRKIEALMRRWGLR